MTDLTDEALDALVNALLSGEQADMDGCRVRISRQACEEAATAITALRTREAASVAAAFEAAAYAVTEADRACLGARGAWAAIRALTPSDATAALEAIKRGERNKARRECAGLVALNAWKHGGDDTYSQGMDAGARHQNAADQAAILATIEPENEE